METADRHSVAETLHDRAAGMRADAVDRHGPAPGLDREAVALDPYEVEPAHYQPDSFPESPTEQLDRLAGIGGAVVTDDRNRVLTVSIGYKDGWQTPGGAQDPGETLAETAVRETREETNVECELTGVFYHRDYAFDYGPDERVRVPMVVFAAEMVGGRRAVPAHRVPTGEPEITDARWFGADELPEDLTDRERIRSYLLERE